MSKEFAPLSVVTPFIVDGGKLDVFLVMAYDFIVEADGFTVGEDGFRVMTDGLGLVGCMVSLVGFLVDCTELPVNKFSVSKYAFLTSFITQ